MSDSPIRRKLVSALKEGPLDAKSAAVLADTTPKVARDYLIRLVHSGVAGSERVRNVLGGSENVTQYFLLPEKQPSRDIGKPRRSVTKTWTANMRRDSLVQALFGPPRTTA